MEKRSFIALDRPLLTVLIDEKSSKSVLETVKKSKEMGAEAFCLMMSSMQRASRTRETLQEIFGEMGDCPAYVTNYLWNENRDMSYDECMEEGLLALECGGAMLDVPGDCFMKSTDEITYFAPAIEKQKKLIKTIQQMGKLALMSSHTKRFLKWEEVLKIAREHEMRGADVTKIVTNADTREELFENYKISLMLKEEIHIPNLFLCNGKECRNHRMISPYIGSCMSLCLFKKEEGKSQPLLKEVKEFLSFMKKE